MKLRHKIPLILGGATIQEFVQLTKIIAGPSVKSCLGKSNKFYNRCYAGLIQLGILDPDKEIQERSTAIAHQFISLVEGYKKLVYLDKDQILHELNNKPFGELSFSVKALLDMYGLSINDFD